VRNLRYLVIWMLATGLVVGVVNAQNAVDLFRQAAGQVTGEGGSFGSVDPAAVLGPGAHPAEPHLIASLWALEDILLSAAGYQQVFDPTSGSTVPAWVQPDGTSYQRMLQAAGRLTASLAAARALLASTPHPRGPALADLHAALVRFVSKGQLSDGTNTTPIAPPGGMDPVTAPAGGPPLPPSEASELAAIGSYFVGAARQARETIEGTTTVVATQLYGKRQLRYGGSAFTAEAQTPAVAWLLAVLRLRTLTALAEAPGGEGMALLQAQLRAALDWGASFVVVEGAGAGGRCFPLLPEWFE